MSRAISLPFSFNSNGQVSFSDDEKKIIQDRIVLAVMTKLGERVMRPDYGSTVHDALFDTYDSARSIVSQAVASCFTVWFSYLELIEVATTVDDNDGVIIFDIKYRKGPVDLDEVVQVRASVLTRAGELIEEI